METLLHFLTEPFAYDFMQRALFISVLTGSVCAIFSCFLVLKGWSLMGDAISHAVLPGLGIAYLLGLPLMIGAFASGLLCALLTGYIKDHSRIKEDAVMGIVFSGLFAAGILLLTTIETDIHLMHILFGNVLGISLTDMIQSGTIASLCIVIMIVKRKDFMLHCFDPVQARSLGMPVKFIQFSLLTLLALTIISSLKAAGIILVIAMLIAPGATALLLCKSFDRMLATSILLANIACLLGLFSSYHFDVATAPMIVCIQASFFMIALLKYRKKTAPGVLHAA